MDQKLYGFWEVSYFPYVAGDEIKSINPDGKIKVHGYPGFNFTPVLILPLEDGTNLNDKILKLKKSYEKHIKSLHQEYSADLNSLLGKNIEIPW